MIMLMMTVSVTTRLCKSVGDIDVVVGGGGDFQYCMVCLFSVPTKHSSTKYSNLNELIYFCLYFVVKF